MRDLLQGMPYSNLAMGIRKGFLEEEKSKKRSLARRKEVRVRHKQYKQREQHMQEGVWNTGSSQAVQAGQVTEQRGGKTQVNESDDICTRRTLNLPSLWWK